MKRRMKQKQKLIMIGGGGHAQSVIDTIKSIGKYQMIGILDKQKHNSFLGGIKIIGEEKELIEYYKKGIRQVVIAIGSVGDTSIRRRIYNTCKEIGYELPNMIDPSATVSKDSIIGDGNFIGKGAIINFGVSIGSGCIINTGAILEHGDKVDDFVHIAPGAVLCGNVWVKKDTHIGANATVLPNVTIGEHSMIGAGSVVLHDISSYKVSYGNPSREVRDNESCHGDSRSRSQS